VISELAKLRGSIAGVGKPKHVGATSHETRDAAWKASQKAKFVEIFNNEEEAQAFVELATEADQQALEKLIALLNNIERNAKKSLGDDENHERSSEDTFRKLTASLNSDVTSLNGTLKKQRENLNGYIRKINELTITIKIREDLLASKKKDLHSTKEERRNKENQYNADKKKRDEEKRVIQKVQKIVSERLARMSQYLRSNVNK